MTTQAITPRVKRMIEDMNARKLCAGTQRGHILSCKQFAAFLKRSPDTTTLEDLRQFQLHLAETGMSICNRNRIVTGLRFLLRGDAATIGPCRRDLSHSRAAEASAGDERRRDQAAAGGRLKSQDACFAQPRLWLRIAGERDHSAQGQAHRQGTEYHSHRAVEGSQRP